MTTAKELAARGKAHDLATGYARRFEAAHLGADDVSAIVASLARTLGQSAGQELPAIVRRALEAGRDYPRGTANELRNLCVSALNKLDAGCDSEELPDWAWVHSGTVTGNGDLRIKLTRDGIVQIIDAAMTPDDLDRIATACRIRAAQRRRGE